GFGKPSYCRSGAYRSPAESIQCARVAWPGAYVRGGHSRRRSAVGCLILHTSLVLLRRIFQSGRAEFRKKTAKTRTPPRRVAFCISFESAYCSRFQFIRSPSVVVELETGCL